ncbi:NAD(P)H-binding protein [Kitasatospora sp. NA04385]|uniref:NAD(P)H-binding protein n=1 Tax=Kitasatospora sp. NA04385 TaxID=2742135 RepID=UPI00158FBD85|nr:NAD(P)H-binding protein [Kitasatospora sp. NA04385]QKW20259.1 NAD(P)H-binding protein [Kitasatospora sp. NA04385]
MIVVTGATGNVGRPLISLLAAAGEQVTAVSRREPAGGLPDGVTHVAADLADFAGLGPALKGADALFLLLAGELNGPGAPATELLDLARESGVRRVVLLSSQINGTRPQAPSHTRLREFELALRLSGLEYTVLRAGGFASNAYAWAEGVRGQRTVRAPFADVALPVVDPADLAAVAAAALREDGHHGQVYVLTGPEAITPRRQAAVLGEALGAEVAFVELSREQARAHLARFMPEEVLDGTLDILGEPLPEEQRVSPDVERVLGRPARGFAQWAREALPAFR